jgi:hypothetical protein
MTEVETGNTVQFLDLLLEFFADGAHWTRGRYHDGHDRHCLVGAIDHLCREHRIPSGKALFYLQEALPPRQRGLVYFNDRYCSGTAELLSIIVKARALALGEAERQRAGGGGRALATGGAGAGTGSDDDGRRRALDAGPEHAHSRAAAKLAARPSRRAGRSALPQRQPLAVRSAGLPGDHRRLLRHDGAAAGAPLRQRISSSPSRSRSTSCG